MSWYHSKPNHPEIEVGSDFVTVRSKHSTTVARILRDETAEGTRSLTLDRLLDRHASTYVERLDDRSERQWHASGAFVSVLTVDVSAASADAE